MRITSTKREKKLEKIFEPYIVCSFTNPWKDNTPPEAIEAFEKWRKLREKRNQFIASLM